MGILELAIHGRGGQGVQLAGTMLASALFREGYFVQSFAAFGGEKRGSPVVSYVRADKKQIRLRSDIESPTILALFDPTILPAPQEVYRLPDTSLCLVNAGSGIRGSASASPHYRVRYVDALDLARRYGLGRFINSVMVGVIAGASGLVKLEDVSAVVFEMVPYRKEENQRACCEGYEIGRRLAGNVNA